MIIRILNNNKVVPINIGLDPSQEDEFLEKNPNLGFLKVESIPSYKHLKMSNGEIVEDEEAVLKENQEMINQHARDQLSNSDWKVIRELERLYLNDTELNTLRESLRNSVVE